MAHADDMVIGFQNEDDARRLLEALKDRFAGFGLAIHEGKTRLIAFGCAVARRREAAGLRRPETFDFLGFTHYCGKTRKGRFVVKRKTQAKRLSGKLKALGQQMARCRHMPLAVQHRWLCQVLRGHYGYYGVTFNYRALTAFFEGIKRRWFRALARRGQKRRMTWQRFSDLLAVFPLPTPRIHHPWASTR